jgi:hypothetical protein
MLGMGNDAPIHLNENRTIKTPGRVAYYIMHIAPLQGVLYVSLI